MDRKITEIEIKGISALLMHSFPLTPVEGLEKMTPAEQAEFSAYRDDAAGGRLFIPGVNMQRAIIAGAVYSKGKGRATLQKPVAACVIVNPERLTLGVTEYKLDSRAVVIPATKGRIVRHRPRLDEWSVEFEIEWDAHLISEVELRRVVDDTGARVGLLDFRPEKKGPFGRFIVTAWKTA